MKDIDAYVVQGNYKKLIGQQPENTEFHFLAMDLRRTKEDKGEALLIFPRRSFMTFLHDCKDLNYY